MAVIDSLGPAARGRRLENFGRLRESDPADDLRERLEEDGYLFVRGLLDRAEVQAGRRELLEQAELRQDYPMRSELLRSIIQGPRIMDFFAGLFGAPARSYDFIWLRHQGPSYGIPPHCDTVFMGRGTPDVLTCWIPFGDIALRGGGLMILENSHKISQERIADYLRQDVDTYCENGPNAEAVRTGQMRWEHWREYAAGKDWKGEITDDALELSEQWGGRWLIADEYRMGDALIFTMRTVHAGTDNETDPLRLSTDSRYQPADQPIDERWIRGAHGEDPVGHGLAAKQGKIC
jgi:ectoine hydroxylase-related dioxygenase (phytanoyl-CoA dioxygenase family)